MSIKVIRRNRIREYFERKRMKSDRELLSRLVEIGERAVEVARAKGEYHDNDGNLRSSLNYAVYHNGRIVREGKPKIYGDGKEGAAKSHTLLAKLQGEYTLGYALVVVAGEDYAEYIEAVLHKDVLTSAELAAEDLCDKLIRKYFKK